MPDDLRINQPNPQSAANCRKSIIPGFGNNLPGKVRLQGSLEKDVFLHENYCDEIINAASKSGISFCGRASANKIVKELLSPDGTELRRFKKIMGDSKTSNAVMEAVTKIKGGSVNYNAGHVYFSCPDGRKITSVAHGPSTYNNAIKTFINYFCEVVSDTARGETRIRLKDL